MRPLAGVRVVDLTMHLAGPTAGMVLGEWGAEVIKLEPLTGDPIRPLTQSGVFDSVRYNFWWEWANRNKQSVAVDLKQPKGKEIAYRLMERADIFVSNVRAKSLARLGMDYQTLCQLNPRLIYAHSTGYGPRGPETDRAGFDDLCTWIRSGIMAVHTPPGLPPIVHRSTVGDTPTGFFLASGAVLGLMHRQRTGKGVEVNASLLATGVWSNLWAIQQYIAGGSKLKQLDRDNVSNPLWNTYPTQDGWLQLVFLREGDWEKLCRALGREELITDPRFDTYEHRCQNNVLLIGILDKEFRCLTSDQWRKRLGQFDLTWEAMQDAEEVVEDPQVLANDYLIEIETPAYGRLKQVATPVQFHKASFKPRRPAPELGEHTAEVLQEIGYSEQEIRELERAGVVACGKKPEGEGKP